MPTLTASRQNPALQALLWLLPTPVETILYVLVAGITVAFGNIETLRAFFYISDQIGFRTAILGSLDNLLAQVLGEQAAFTLVTAAFWGVIGMSVYVLIWLLGNFSTELSNDLIIRKFMHPRGADTYEPLKWLILKLVFHIFVILLMVFYLHLFVTVLLPGWMNQYAELVRYWPSSEHIYGFLKTFLSQMLGLHVIVVLCRLLLLRKRVFDS